MASGLPREVRLFLDSLRYGSGNARARLEDGHPARDPVSNYLLGSQVEGRKTVLRAIAKFPRLKCLNLKGYNIHVSRQHEVQIICDGLVDRCLTTLETLKLSGNHGFGTPDGCFAVSDILRTSKCLKVLEMSDVGMTATALRHTIETLCSNPVLEELDVSLNGLHDEGGHLLASLLQFTEALRTLDIAGISMGLDGARHFAEALARNQSLKKLKVSRNSDGSLTPVNEIVKACIPRPSLSSNLTEEASTVLGGTSSYNRTLSILDIDILHATEDQDLDALGELVADMLKVEDTSLRELGLHHTRFSSSVWQRIFHSLRRNRTLRILHLRGCEGLTPVFKELDKLLDINMTIRAVDVADSDLEPWMVNRVVEKVETNEKEGRRLAELKDRQSRKHPKHGRLFLFGPAQANAGKSTLGRTMAQCVEHRSRWKRKMEHGVETMLHKLRMENSVNMRGKLYPRKTIDVLRLDHGTEISVWDVDGHDEFLGLHDCLFPRSYQPCVYFFVFNLLKTDPNHAAETNDLEKELLFLLRFIKSNSRRSARNQSAPGPQIPYSRASMTENQFARGPRMSYSSESSSSKTDYHSELPQVMVIFTHPDKLLGKKDRVELDRYESSAKQKVNRLRQRFQGHVQVRETVHFVDARNPDYVYPVLEEMSNFFRQALNGLHPDPVPDACLEMPKVLADWKARHSSNPIMSIPEFENLCLEKGRELKLGLDSDDYYRQTADHASSSQVLGWKSRAARIFFQDTREEVLRYLHDVGIIIYFESMSFIVVDLNWLVEVFLRALIQFGNAIPSNLKGFVPKEPVEDSLRQFIENSKLPSVHLGLSSLMKKEIHHRYSVTVDNLLQLMTTLELCHEDAHPCSVAGYFVPTRLIDQGRQASNGRRKLEWQVQGRGLVTYVGRRLLCSDRDRTILTPGFFPRFQVYLRKKLENAFHNSSQYHNERNLIGIHVNGYEIFVESSGDNGEYVDVLARSSTTLWHTVNFIQNYVLKNLREFCSSSTGCPGVELVEAIIRPLCVKNLTVCEDRRNQVVLVDDLKKHIESSQNDTTTVMHTWPAGPSNCPLGFDKVTDLLPRLNLLPGLDDTGEQVQSIEPNTLELLMAKLDSLLGITQDIYNQRKLPGLPYLTDSISKRQKIIAAVTIGQPYSLHLMCEKPNAPHVVESQKGLEITVTDPKWDQLRSVVAVLSKMTFYVVKAGLQVGAGIGQALPNYPDMEFAIPLSVTTLALEGMLPNDIKLSPVEMGNYDEARQFLREFLARKENEIYKLFQLSKVKYVAGSFANRVEWVCDRCRREGMENKILEPFPR